MSRIRHYILIGYLELDLGGGVWERGQLAVDEKVDISSTDGLVHLRVLMSDVVELSVFLLAPRTLFTSSQTICNVLLALKGGITRLTGLILEACPCIVKSTRFRNIQ